MAFVICCSILYFPKPQKKNKSLLSAPCINRLVKAIAERTQQWWDMANKSNFGLPFPVFSLKLSRKKKEKKNPGGDLEAVECALLKRLNSGRYLLICCLTVFFPGNRKICLLFDLGNLLFPLILSVLWENNLFFGE